MAKARPQKPIPLGPRPPRPSQGQQGFPRLDGDHLYAWAQMIQREQQAREAKESMAINLLTSLGYTPGQYLLTADGYIITPDQARRMGSQSPDPAQPKVDPAEPTADLSLPGSGS